MIKAWLQLVPYLIFYKSFYTNYVILNLDENRLFLGQHNVHRFLWTNFNFDCTIVVYLVVNEYL